MTIDPASGIVRWQPGSSMIGTHRVAVRATDPPGAFDTQTYILEVFDPATDLQILSPIGYYAGKVGQTLTLPLQANYAKAIFSADPLPANASILGNNFSFTPGASQEGNNTVSFRARLND